MSSKKKDHRDFQPIADIDRIIHEPARLMILTFLYGVERADFIFLTRQTNLTKGNLSSHLSKLEAVGYVDIEKKFVNKIPRTLLRLTKRGRKAFQIYRQNMKNVFEDLPE